MAILNGPGIIGYAKPLSENIKITPRFDGEGDATIHCYGEPVNF